MNIKKIINNFPLLILLSILILHAVILSRLIFFPYPEVFIYPYLTNNGLKPYSQILDQHFPGLMFLPVNFDNLGMHSEIEARIWLIGVVLLTQILLFFVSKLIFENPYKALLANFLYLIWQPFFEGWVFWIDNLIPLFSLASFYFVYKYTFEKKNNLNLIFAGLFLGLGIVFKQTLIPLTGLVLLYMLYLTRAVKPVTIFSVASVVPMSLVVLYYIQRNIFYDFWYWTITFNLTVYSKFGIHVERPIGYFTRVGLVFGTALISLIFKKKKQLLLLGIFLIGSLFGAFDRLDFVHLQPALPFAILLTIIGFETFLQHRYLKLTVLIYLFISIWWLGVFYRGHISDRVLFFDQHNKQIASKIREYTSPKEKIFVFGAAPHLYQMSNTLPAGDIFVFQFPWFTYVAEERILDGLKRDEPNIVVYDPNPKFNNQFITEYMYEVNGYILDNYNEVDRLGDTLILKKRE